MNTNPNNTKTEQNSNLGNYSKKTLKTFGYIWALIFFTIAYKKDINSLFLVSFLFFISASFFPKIYVKSNIFQLWISLGDFIGKINSKIIIFILFFLIFTPISIILKIFNKDLLSKKINKKSDSYFKPRVTPSQNMKNQF